jgi:putative folate metabolism gamma-glutamate ligase
MNIKGIQTKIFEKNNSLFEFLKENLENLELENSIVAITSKIISIAENRTIKKNSIDKKELIKKEADFFLEKESYKEGHTITIKNNILIPSAGIDESNSKDGDYILYPKDPMNSAFEIWSFLKNFFKVKNLGIIITDSHTTPLRSGVIGIGIAWCGFQAVYSYIGKPDIFSIQLKCTKLNVLDALSVCAVFEMGEADEKIPIVQIKDFSKVLFSNSKPTENEISELNISIENDIYGDILKSCNWTKNKIE